LHLTPKGHRVLRTLSEDHERELHELVPRLIRALTLIRSSEKHSSPSRTRATLKGNPK
jgi:hypothetical protein